MDEFSLISRYFAPLAGEGAFALTDDAAAITPPAGKQLVLTKDCMVAGVHFIGDEDPSLIARKLLRVNLSDLASMGAKAHGYLVGLMLPKDTQPEWFERFAHGLAVDQDLFGVTLLGGDTTATPGPLSLSLTAIGFTRSPLTRAGAKVGDDVYVTGTIGDAALGLDAIRKGTKAPSLIQRYQLPEPRLAIGAALHGVAHACIDISDGLLADAGHIAKASGVGIELEAALIPLSENARVLLTNDPSRLERIVTGGDDYELLFTSSSTPPAGATRIGKVVAGNGVTLRDGSGNVLSFARKGYTHF